MKATNLNDIIKELKEPIIATVHKDPDPDAIGSLLAFYYICQQFNIEIECYASDYDELKFNYLPGSSLIVTTPSKTTYNTLVLLDCSNINRVYKKETLPKANQIINIDHHQDNALYGTINLVQNISSVGELLFSQCMTMNINLTKNIAENLYAAIAFDTGSFQYSNTTAQTFIAAQKLIEQNINTTKINQHLFDNKSTEYYNEIKIGLENLYVDESYPILITHIPIQKKPNKDSCINFFRQYENKEVIIICKEIKKNMYKISFRSKTYINVANIANAFDGGGHIRASGATFSGTFPELKKQLLTECIKEFNQ